MHTPVLHRYSFPSAGPATAAHPPSERRVVGPATRPLAAPRATAAVLAALAPSADARTACSLLLRSQQRATPHAAGLPSARPAPATHRTPAGRSLATAA